MKSRIIYTKYDKTRKYIITTSAEEWGILPNTDNDISKLLQEAIDECHLAGGGILYIPEGYYHLKHSVRLKTAVTLLGDWINLDEEDNSGRGTTFCCYYGHNTPEGRAQFEMEACTGVIGVTCYYPEQCMDNVYAYSPTFRQDGIDSITLENVTLVNPYIGIQCGPDGNELHYLKNVLISPLSVGFYMDMTTDIGRMEGVKISPKYYERFTLTPGNKVIDQNTKATLYNYMFENAVGIFMARSDWEYGYDIEIEGCKNGLLITSMADIGPNTQISRLHIKNCEVGIRIIRANAYGIAISNSIIEADKSRVKAAILIEEEFTTLLQLNQVKLEGTYPVMVQMEGSGQAGFIDCKFGGKNQNVLQKSGGLSLINCFFETEGDHVYLAKNIGGTQIIGCKAIGCEVHIIAEEEAKKELVYDEAAVDMHTCLDMDHKPYPYSTQPSFDYLYDVKEYGALGDGMANDTGGFLRALEQAKTTGGIVYVPPGMYRITESLCIPQNVELRGIFEVPCHTLGGGSILEADYGAGEEDAKPLIVMEEESGVRGIVIHYPEQDPTTPIAFPWSIQTRGNRCYVINTVFVNSWLGLDMGTYGCEEHYVSYISGAPIRCGVFLGNNKKEGWVENIQYNPHYWYRSSLPNHPSNDTWKSFWHNQIKYLDAIKFGYNEKEHLLNTFVFAAKNGLYFTDQNGKATNGLFIGHGTDGGEKGLRVDSVGQVDMINTELVTIESPNQRTYIYVTSTGEGEIRLHNTLMWGAPNIGVEIDDGKIQLNQTNFVDQGECAILTHGGNLTLNGSYFYHNTNHVRCNDGNVRLIANMTPKIEKNGQARNHSIQSVCRKGTVFQKWNWSK